MRNLFCGAAIATLLATPVMAQTTAKPQAAPAASDDAIAELIVTARRREEKVQDVPAAVTGISATQIQELGGIRDIKDLSYLLPGLAFVNTGNINAENNIRGAGSGTARTAGVDSPIAVLRDGSSITGGNIGGRTFTRSDLFDVERVEETRGPQGSLYGVNAVGGVLQAITQRPKDSFGTSVGETYSPDIGRSQLDGEINIPLPDLHMGLRIGGEDVDRSKGFFKNLFTGGYGDIEKFRVGRVGLEWKPISDLDVYMVLDQSDEISASNTIRQVDAVNDKTLPAAQFGPPDLDGPFVFSQNGSNRVNRNVLNFSTQVDWTTSFGKLTSVTLVRNRHTNFSQDADGSAPGYATPPFPGPTCATRNCETVFTDLTQIASEDLRFAGEFNSRLSYMVGANVEGEQSDFVTIVDGRTTSAANLAPSPTVNQSAVDNEEEFQTGAFVSVSWKATDKLTIDAAARYNHSDKKDDAYGVTRLKGAINCVAQYTDPEKVFATNPACVNQRNLINSTFANTAPSVSAKYDIEPNWRVFASAAIGYRAGGFNTNSVLDPQITPTYQPEKNVALEAGTKWELWGGYWTATAFRNNFDNLLVTLATIGPDGVSRNSRVNAGKADTYGIDFEVFGGKKLPGEWGALSYTAAINWLEGTINSGPFSGRTVEGSPEYTYTASLFYRKPLVDDWRLVVSGSYRGQRGGYTNTARIDNAVKAADFDIFNGSIGVENSQWRLDVSATNLFNKAYVILRDPTDDVYGDPREVRVALHYAFGSEARH